MIKLIEPLVELIKEDDPYKKIEFTGRVCYKSENRITDTSSKPFVSMLYKNKHLAMMEHAIYYFYSSIYDKEYDVFTEYSNLPFINITLNTHENNRIIISANLRALIENGLASIDDQGNIKTYIKDCVQLSQSQFNVLPNKNEDEILKHYYTTMKFTCDRGVSHELVRHRLFSFAQESTRYVKYNNNNMYFIKPTDYDNWDTCRKNCFKDTLSFIENNYSYMMLNGSTAQEARSILPNALKTEIVVTGNDKEWQHFFDLRCAKDAHPDMRKVAIIARDLYDEERKCI